jgi:small subunit ribosomal protein S8
MSQSDPIADFLTRMRNAVRARHPRVDIPLSRVKKDLCRIFKQEGFIDDYKIIDFQGKLFLRILLKYQPNGNTVIEGIKRVSTPGLRVYVSKDKIPRVLDGLGISILTTSKGIMTGRQAKKLGVGGEVICQLW